jgi:TRAP-type transport system small permease protein
MDLEREEESSHNAVINCMAKTTELILGILVAAITVILFVSTIFRYFLGLPVGWSDEISRMLFMWITFLGAAVCAFREGHTKFTILVNKLSAQRRSYVHFISSILVFSVSVCLAYFGFKAISLISYEVFVILDITYIFAYISFPVSFLMISVYLLIRLIERLMKKRHEYSQGAIVNDMLQKKCD